MIFEKKSYNRFIKLIRLVWLTVGLCAGPAAWCEEPELYKINDIIEQANDLDGKRVVNRRCD